MFVPEDEAIATQRKTISFTNADGLLAATQVLHLGAVRLVNFTYEVDVATAITITTSTGYSNVTSGTSGTVTVGVDLEATDVLTVSLPNSAATEATIIVEMENT